MIKATIEDVVDYRTELDLLFSNDPYENKLKAVYYKGLDLLEEMLEKGIEFDRPCAEADDTLLYTSSFLTDNNMIERACKFVYWACDSFYDQVGRYGSNHYELFCRDYDKLLNKYVHLGMNLREFGNTKLAEEFIQSFDSLFGELRLLLNLPLMNVTFHYSMINCFNKPIKKHKKFLKKVEKKIA